MPASRSRVATPDHASTTASGGGITATAAGASLSQVGPSPQSDYYQRFLPSNPMTTIPAVEPIPPLATLAELQAHLLQLKAEASAKGLQLEQDSQDFQARTTKYRKIVLAGRLTAEGTSNAAPQHSEASRPVTTPVAHIASPPAAIKPLPEALAHRVASPSPLSQTKALVASPPDESSLPRIDVKRELIEQTIASTPEPPLASGSAGPREESADTDIDTSASVNLILQKKQLKRKRKRQTIEDSDGDTLTSTDGERSRAHSPLTVLSESVAPEGSVPPSAPAPAMPKLKLRLAPRAAPDPISIGDQKKLQISKIDRSTSAVPASDVETRKRVPTSNISVQIPVPPAWALPTVTPLTFVPKLPKTSPAPAGPTRPEQVNDDFANRDWRERDRDRTVQSSSGGAAIISSSDGAHGDAPTPTPTTAVGRGRAREQNQTPLSAFFTYADAFFKTLTEDDLAWLSSKGDADLEPFQFPLLGRYYRELWEEEDIASGLKPPTSDTNTDAPGATVDASGNPVPFPPESASQLQPAELTDRHLTSHDAQAGPFAERLLAALMPVPSSGGNDFPEVDMQPATNGQPRGDARVKVEEDGKVAVAANGPNQKLADYDQRVRHELAALDIMGDVGVDWTTRADDEISTALRLVQSQLHRQVRVNDARKGRLFDIAMDRMAYQDYVACLNSVERDIEAGWNKRQRQIKATLGKKKKGTTGTQTNGGPGGSEPHSTEGSSSNLAGPSSPGGTPLSLPVPLPSNLGASGSSTPGPSGTSGGPPPSTAETASRLQFPPQLIAALARRRKLQEAFQPMFDKCQHAWRTPGRDESIYEDLGIEKGGIGRGV